MIIDRKVFHIVMWSVVFMVFWFSHSTHQEILEERELLKVVYAAKKQINLQGINELQCIAGEVTGVVHTGVFSQSLHRFEPVINCNDKELDSINFHRHESEEFYRKFVGIWVAFTIIYGFYALFVLISPSKREGDVQNG